MKPTKSNPKKTHSRKQKLTPPGKQRDFHSQARFNSTTPAEKTRVFLFNKPFQVLCQFSASEGKKTLADFFSIPSMYPAGRLDFDSEGLLLLTNDGKFQHKISHPSQKLPKTYAVQVEGTPTQEQLQLLRLGVELKDGLTQPAKVEIHTNQNPFPPREPPIRVRKNIPDTWLEIKISEGRNRQVRRMTAAVGLPTLRLIRTHIGSYSIDRVEPGNFEEILDFKAFHSTFAEN